MADSSLWPLAMEYAAFVYNCMSQTDSGVAHIDTFTSTTILQQCHKTYMCGDDQPKFSMQHYTTRQRW